MKYRLLLALCCLFALAYQECLSGRPVMAETKEPIRFTAGLDPAMAHGIIADKLGLFKKHGVNVSVKKYSSAAEGVRSVLAGENDAGQSGDTVVISPLAQGSEVKIIATTRKKLKKYTAAVGADFIKKPSDLNGRRIGMLRGGPTSHFFFESFASFHKIEKVERVFLRPQEQLIAFSKGEIDALFVFSPWWQKALEVRPGSHVIAYDYENDVCGADATISMHPRLGKDPQRVEAMLSALIEADVYLNNNPNGAAELLSGEINLTPKEVLSILEKVEQRLALDEIMVTNFCRATKFMLSIGQITKEPDWDAAVADQYLRSVSPERVTFSKPIKCMK